MDGSLDSLVASVARKSRRRSTTFPCACNISQLVSYFFPCFCSSFLPSSYLDQVSLPLHLLPSIIDFSSRCLHLRLHSALFLLTPSCLICVFARRFIQMCCIKYNWLDSFTSNEGQEGIADIPLLVCFLSPPIANELIRTLRHLWFIRPTPTHKSSTLCTKWEGEGRASEGWERASLH